MAWDALASIYRNKSEDETAQTRDNRASTGNVGATSAQAAPLTGWGGGGGSAGAPASSRFINFGTYMDLNKDKASGMAKGLYDSAQAKAEGAQGKLNDARGAFAGQVAGGTAKGTIGGPHGTEMADPTKPAQSKPTITQTRIEQRAAVPVEQRGSHISASTVGPPVAHGAGAPATQFRGDGTGGVVVMDSSAQDTQDAIDARKTFDNRKAVGAAAVGAGKYQGIFDGLQYGHGLAMGPEEKTNAVNYNHFANELDAKSNAGQGYTGPDSLKGSMGDDAYGALAEDLRKAEQGTQQLGDAAGIATALGYEPGGNIGMSALDAGLTQTAGRPQFKQLGDKYRGLGKTLSAAQADSMNAAAGAKLQSEAAANQWQSLLNDYNTKKDAPAPEVEKTTQEKMKEQNDDLRDYAFFVGGGATDNIDAMGKGVASALTITQKDAFSTLKSMGYSNDVIQAAWKKYRAENGDKWPTAAELAKIILGGGL